MTSFESCGAVSLPPALLARIRGFISGRIVDDAGIVAALKRARRDDDYVVCPHTAVAVAAFYAARGSGSDGGASGSLVGADEVENEGEGICPSDATTTTTVVVATASPAKFPEALEAAGLEKVVDPKIEKVMKMKTKFRDLEAGQNWTEVLREKVVEISRCKR